MVLDMFILRYLLVIQVKILSRQLDMYVIIDFDSESFEKLCSNNIGNTVFESVGELSYTTDFKFQIEGSVVNS